MKRYTLNWPEVHKLKGIRYICGHCGTDTSPLYGWSAIGKGDHVGYIMICTGCNRPSFIDIEAGVQTTIPTVKMGNDVKGLPGDVDTLYDDARKCTSAGAYTSAVLTCRKILMHIAVEKGAEPGKRFIDYIKFLKEKNYIPPDGEDWVTHILDKSNEANHEIIIMTKDDAEDLITFTEMLLRLVFEFKERLPKKDSENSPS